MLGIVVQTRDHPSNGYYLWIRDEIYKVKSLDNMPWIEVDVSEFKKSVKIKSDAEAKAQYDYYYNKEMERLNND
jgi:hypothetical protein